MSEVARTDPLSVCNCQIRQPAGETLSTQNRRARSDRPTSQFVFVSIRGWECWCPFPPCLALARKAKEAPFAVTTLRVHSRPFVVEIFESISGHRVSGTALPRHERLASPHSI